MCLVSKILSAFLLNHAKISEQPNTNYKLKKKITADVTFSFTEPIPSVVQDTKSDIMLRQKKKKKGGHFKSKPIFRLHYISFNLKVLFSLSLSLTRLFPFNDLQDTYCIFSFRLNFIGKKKKKHTPVSTDLMQERECEILF